MSFRNLTASLLVMMMFFTFACTQKAAKPQATMDTPEHHVMSGNKLLEAGNIDGAIAEFERLGFEVTGMYPVSHDKEKPAIVDYDCVLLRKS